MTNILVEGGAAILGGFLDTGALDEVHVFVAPLLAGGVAAKSPVGGTGVSRIAEALKLGQWQVERIEDDVFLHGWIPQKPSSPPITA
jgi:diaminohydroxyphosphoribosylaminopyrimidine deaminase/5-amino-6-(5-phosphoribosylamino)uracil reductase